MRKPKTLSVRHTDKSRANLAVILERSDCTTASEAVIQALDLYAAYLSFPRGAAVYATGHTRKGRA
ncbi:hypothetical protein GCM10010266_53160 [Streptomyces griseomycini]|nr:hypothetical protein GCM10010266_53160 [Streptomyces griseomycini]